jgi:formylglycine-generating enzyme required for sulfatase activity
MIWKAKKCRAKIFSIPPPSILSDHVFASDLFVLTLAKAFKAMKHALLALMLLSTASAQQAALKPVTGKKVALVIGNNGYTASPLKNCVSDAAAIAKLLREQLNFDTVLADRDSENLDRLAFTRRLQAFQKEAQGAAVAVFYYAGHGMEDFDGRDNYLIPVDADLTEAAKDNAGLQAQGIPLDFVLKTMKEATQGAKIILLDCCRERPADRAIQTRDGGGFVMPTDSLMPQDTLIMLAAAPARTASDGEGHGPSTAALIKHLPSPGTALFQTFRTVRNEVLTATNQQQKPWLKLDGAGDFFYDHALKAGSADESKMTEVPPPTATSPLDASTVGKQHEVTFPGSVKLSLCFCPAGSFTMGSPASEADRSSVEDQVKVTLTQPFWLARTELTQAQWRAVMGTEPSFFKGDELPVECVSWEDAQAFIVKLNEIAPLKGWKWVLPSEAQWEYACRAGTTTPFSFGSVLNGKEANCAGNKPYGTSTEGPYLEKTAPVGSYSANAWGLCDMHGNVYEWCADAWDGSTKLRGGTNPLGTTGSGRVDRGGSWYGNARNCRAASRFRYAASTRHEMFGFRPAAVPSGAE